jgi:tagatose-1,6-bisphosphate aldolase
MNAIPEFVESLELAAEAGVKFSGILCGSATWKDGFRLREVASYSRAAGSIVVDSP